MKSTIGSVSSTVAFFISWFVRHDTTVTLHLVTPFRRLPDSIESRLRGLASADRHAINRPSRLSEIDC
jgi:hypothetical protein